MLSTVVSADHQYALRSHRNVAGGRTRVLEELIEFDLIS